MCGRARCVLSADAIQASSGIPMKQFQDFHTYQPKENMTPGSQFPVLFADPQTGTRVLQSMTWGLVPSYTSLQGEKPDYFKMFNARLETLDEKISFQNIAKTNRCVVLMSGYFEWQECSDTGRKQPYYVSRPDGEPIFLAGVYDTWKGGTAAALYSFSIITAPSSASLKPGLQSLHPRQPVFLCSPEAISRWLTGSDYNSTPTPLPRSLLKHEGGTTSISKNNTVVPSTSSLVDTSKAPDDLVIHPVTQLMSHASYQRSDCSERIQSPLKSKRMTDFFTKSPVKAASSPSTSTSSILPVAGAETASAKSTSNITKGSNRGRGRGNNSSPLSPPSSGRRNLMHFLGKSDEKGGGQGQDGNNKNTENANQTKKIKTEKSVNYPCHPPRCNGGEDIEELDDAAVALLSEDEQLRRAIAASLRGQQ